MSFYAKLSEIKSFFYPNQPMIVLLYKETFLNTNELDLCLPSMIYFFLIIIIGVQRCISRKVS